MNDRAFAIEVFLWNWINLWIMSGVIQNTHRSVRSRWEQRSHLWHSCRNLPACQTLSRKCYHFWSVVAAALPQPPPNVTLITCYCFSIKGAPAGWKLPGRLKSWFSHDFLGVTRGLVTRWKLDLQSREQLWKFFSDCCAKVHFTVYFFLFNHIHANTRLHTTTGSL